MREESLRRLFAFAALLKEPWAVSVIGEYAHARYLGGWDYGTWDEEFVAREAGYPQTLAEKIGGTFEGGCIKVTMGEWAVSCGKSFVAISGERVLTWHDGTWTSVRSKGFLDAIEKILN
jgi:hypothetical protein